MDQPRNAGAVGHEAEPEGDTGAVLQTISASEVLSKVESLAREQPHLALASAFAFGFVIGGGITPRVLGSLAAVGARAYLQSSMAELAHRVVGGE